MAKDSPFDCKPGMYQQSALSEAENAQVVRPDVNDVASSSLNGDSDSPATPLNRLTCRCAPLLLHPPLTDYCERTTPGFDDPTITDD